MSLQAVNPAKDQRAEEESSPQAVKPVENRGGKKDSSEGPVEPGVLYAVLTGLPCCLCTVPVLICAVLTCLPFQTRNLF